MHWRQGNHSSASHKLGIWEPSGKLMQMPIQRRQWWISKARWWEQWKEHWSWEYWWCCRWVGSITSSVGLCWLKSHSLLLKSLEGWLRTVWIWRTWMLDTYQLFLSTLWSCLVWVNWWHYWWTRSLVMMNKAQNPIQWEGWAQPWILWAAWEVWVEWEAEQEVWEDWEACSAEHRVPQQPNHSKPKLTTSRWLSIHSFWRTKRQTLSAVLKSDWQPYDCMW